MACMSAATQFFHALTSGFAFLAFYFLFVYLQGRSHWLLMFVTDNFLRRLDVEVDKVGNQAPRKARFVDFRIPHPKMQAIQETVMPHVLIELRPPVV